MLGYKISLEDLRRLKSYQAFFFQPKLYETRNQFQLILKKTGKLQSMQTKNTHLSNQQFKEEIKRKKKKKLETIEKGSTRNQSLWDAAKVVLRGKLIAITAYIKRKKERIQPNLTLQGTRR